MPADKVSNYGARYQPYDLGRRPLHTTDGHTNGQVVRDAPKQFDWDDFFVTVAEPTPTKPNERRINFTVYDNCAGRIVPSIIIPKNAQLRMLDGYIGRGKLCQFACDPNGSFTSSPSRITKPNDGTQSYFIVGNTGDKAKAHLFWRNVQTSGCISFNQNDNETIPMDAQNLGILCKYFDGDPDKVVSADGLCPPLKLAPIPPQNAPDKVIPSPNVAPVIDASSFISNYGYLGLIAVVPVSGTIALAGVTAFWVYKKCFSEKE